MLKVLLVFGAGDERESHGSVVVVGSGDKGVAVEVLGYQKWSGEQVRKKRERNGVENGVKAGKCKSKLGIRLTMASHKNYKGGCVSNFFYKVVCDKKKVIIKGGL